jgi:hypothetical protein
VRFAAGDFVSALGELPAAPSAVVVMDALHYLDHQEQDALVTRVWDVLGPGGVLLVREVDTAAGFTSWVNRLHERMMTWLGFTRAGGLAFRTGRGWEQLFAAHGFTVESEPCGSWPFADRLFVCRKS